MVATTDGYIFLLSLSLVSLSSVVLEGFLKELKAFSSLSTHLIAGDSESVLQHVMSFITDPAR